MSNIDIFYDFKIFEGTIYDYSVISKRHRTLTPNEHDDNLQKEKHINTVTKQVKVNLDKETNIGESKEININQTNKISRYQRQLKRETSPDIESEIKLISRHEINTKISIKAQEFRRRNGMKRHNTSAYSNNKIDIMDKHVKNLTLHTENLKEIILLKPHFIIMKPLDIHNFHYRQKIVDID